MKNKKSTRDCQTVEEMKELAYERYKEWYEKGDNREKRLEYYREYYRKSKMQKALSK